MGVKAKKTGSRRPPPARASSPKEESSEQSRFSPRVDVARYESFLELLREGWSVFGACKRAEIAPALIAHRRRTDPDFETAVIEAIQHGTEYLEDLAKERAFHGTDKPIIYQGEITGSYKERSDVLSIFLLKARDPGRFSDRVDLTSGGKAIGEAFREAALASQRMILERKGTSVQGKGEGT